MKQITFKHYRTGDNITIECEEMPYNNDQSEYLIVKNFTNDCIEAIIRSSIVSIEDL